jgi:putative redox protein
VGANCKGSTFHVPWNQSITALLQCNILPKRSIRASTPKHHNSTKTAHRHPKRTMECTINWMPSTGMGFCAETGSGHFLTMDGAPDGGGRNLAPRPMETLLAGAGGCTAYDVVLILKKGRHDVRGCQVKVQAERADTDPKVFTQIKLHFVVSGRNLPATAVERAVALSHERYCSATIMLAKTASISTSFEVVEV